MRRMLTVAVMAATTLLATGATATASESPSPSSSSDDTTTADSPDSATPLERVRAYTQPSVVYIETTWTGYVYDTFNKLYLNNNKPITVGGGCTGFVLTEDGYIGTAGHCVNTPETGEPAMIEKAAQWALDTGYYQADNLSIDDVLGFNDYVIQDQSGRRAKPQMKVTVAWAESAGGVETSKGLPARVVKWQRFAQGDGAVLKVEESGLNALPLADADIEVGTDVISVGYPGSVDTVADPDFSPSFKEGSVSSKKTMSGGLTTVYEISAAMSGGMSGGPTVNLDGEVVGINSFGPAAETQQFNFIQPVSVIRELLGDAGTESTLSEDTTAYRNGLDAYFDGDKAAAVENLETVVDNQPTNQLAKEYLDKAQELPDPPKAESSDEGGSSMGLIIGIVVGAVVLLAILAAVLLAMSRRKKGGSSTTAAGAAYGGVPPAVGPGYPQPGGPGSAPGATSTAVLTPTALQAGPSPSAPPPTQAQVPPPAPVQPTPPPPAPSVAPSVAPAEPQSAAVQPTPETVDETIFCQNCGTKGDPGQKFCKHCGTAL